MIRVFAVGIALALAIAMLPPATPSAEAADKGKSPKKGSVTPDRAATMTAIALAESKKKKGLKAKESGERAKTRRGTTDCEGYTYMGQQILGTSCRAK